MYEKISFWINMLTWTLVPALTGYGIFWWYRMPFGIGPVHVGVSVMVACYVSALVGRIFGTPKRNKK